MEGFLVYLGPVPRDFCISLLRNIRPTFSAEPVNQATNQPKRPKKGKQLKSMMQSIALPPTSIFDNCVGFSIDMVPGNLHNNINANHSICDQECG